jgi:hypothetical protein
MQRDRLRARTRRFAADVQNVSPFFDECPRMRHCDVTIEMKSAVRKGIRGDVYHPHHKRTIQGQSEVAALNERHGVNASTRERVNG